MASWVGGLSSSLGSCLGQMSHSVVSFTRHISRCTKDVWMVENKTEESNELKRKEVETTKETVRPKVERFMTFYTDLDLENKQETAVYSDLLIKKDLDIKLFMGKEILVTQKLQNLQKDTQSINGAAGFTPVMSLTSWGKNIILKSSDYNHELEHKNLEVKILRETHEAMKRRLLKLQKASESINVAAGLVPPMPALISMGDNMDPEPSEYQHQIEQQNLKMKILRERHGAMKHKLLKLQKAIQYLNVAAGLLPAMSSTSLGENIDPNASEYEHELEQKNLEVKILRGRNVVMKHKLFKLQKTTQCLNVAAGLKPAMPVLTSRDDNIDHNTCEYKNQLEQQNLEMKILRGRNVAMKHKLLKLRKATECLKAATGLKPAIHVSTSLGNNIDHNASEYKNQLKQQNLEMEILRGRNVAMKHKLLQLRKATQCLNVAAGLLPAMSSAPLGENIDPNASKYEHELEQKNLEVNILRGRNVATKHKLLKLQKSTQFPNVAAGLLPAMSSAPLGENIDPIASEYEHELEQKNLEVKILRGRNVAMKHKLLQLQKATQCLNAAAGLLPAMSSTSLGENTDPNASQYEHELEQKNLEVKILRGRNVAMKHKLLQLRKATESLKAAVGLPAMSSPSMGENIDSNASEYEHELEQKNLEVKILRGRNVAMKYKLLKLWKVTQCLNVAAGLLPAMSSASLGENINPNASEYEHELEQKNLEVKILRGRNVAMKHQLLKLQKATECLNAAAGLLPVMSSVSLGENIDPDVSEYEHKLEQKNFQMKILRGRHGTMKYKSLKLQNANQSINVAPGLEPAIPALTSLGDNIDHKASEYTNQLEQQNLQVNILRRRNVAMKHKLLKLRKATQCLNAAAGLLPVMSSTSLGENIDTNVSEYEHKLEQKNLEVKILRGRNVAMKHKLLQLRKATESLKAAVGLPAMSSASMGENIDSNASEYEHELQQKNLEVKILRGKNVAMKYKLLKLWKVTQCLNVAAGLLPAMSSASLGENINPNASEYEHELEQKNLEVKILRGRNVAMKHQLLKLQKATECLNAAAGLLPVMSSVSLGENIDPNVSEYEHKLGQKNFQMKILRGRHGVMKYKSLKLQNANQSINVAPGLEPAIPALTSLGDNIDHKASEYTNQLEQQNLQVNILRQRNVAMKHKLLKLRKATQWLNVAAGLLPVMSLASLGENIDPSASEYEHELEQKNLEVKILRGRNVAMKHKLLKLRKANQCLNVAAGVKPDMPALTSLGDKIDHKASEHTNQLEQQNLKMKILRGRNVAMKHKLLKLRKAIQCLNAAVGLLPAMSSASLVANINPNPSEHKHELEQKNLEMKILRERHSAMKRKLLKLHSARQSINVPAGLIPAMPASTSLGDIDPNASEDEQHLQLKSIDHHTSSTYQHLQNRLTRWIWSKVFPAYSETNAACHT